MLRLRRARTVVAALTSVGGSVFSAGVKGRFADVYAGANAAEASIAKGLRDREADQIKSVSGHLSADVC